MVPIIEEDCIILLGIGIYVRNIILLGSTTKKNLLIWVEGLGKAEEEILDPLTS